MSLLIPAILPDEFAPGYMGRIAVLNGLKNPRRVQRLLHIQASATKTNDWQPPVVDTLAELAERDISDFVCNHTLVPFYSAVRNKMQPHGYAGRERSGPLYQLGLKADKTGPYQCAACVREDLHFWGFAYWRRSHQVPGVTHCTKHLTKLESVKGASFGNLPRALEKPSNPKCEEFPLAPALTKYSEISNGLLEVSSTLPRLHVTRCLADRARILGIRGIPTGNRPVLSDLALEQMPKKWLEDFFPSIASKTKGSFVHPFDYICVSGSKLMQPACYPLAATLLYDTAEDALRALCNVNEDLSLRRKTNSCLPRLDHRRMQLHQAYIECAGNYAMAQGKLGLQEMGARNAFRNAGLPSIARTPDGVCRALLSLSSGTPLDMACKEHQVDSADVIALLVESARPFIATLHEIDKKTNGFRERVKRRLKSN